MDRDCFATLAMTVLGIGDAEEDDLGETQGSELIDQALGALFASEERAFAGGGVVEGQAKLSGGHATGT